MLDNDCNEKSPNLNSSEHSSRSSPDLIMTEATIKNAEQEYRICQELIQQNLIKERQLKDEIEKKDKECNLLKYKVENLKKQCADAEKLTADLRKCVFSTQMEIENISAEILQQKTTIENQFPSDGLQFYTEMVNVTAHMIDYVKNLQASLARNVQEYTRYDGELSQWRNSINNLRNNIKSIKTVQKKNENQLKLIVETDKLQSPDNLASLESNTTLLNSEYKEFENLKNKLSALEIKKDGLKEFQRQTNKKCQENEAITEKILREYSEVYDFYQIQYNSLRKLEVEIKGDYFKMLKNLDVELNQVDQMTKTLEKEIINKKHDLKILTMYKIQLSKDINEISLKEEKICQLEEKMKATGEGIEMEQVNENLLCTQYEEIDKLLDTEISNNQEKLNKILHELKHLENENQLHAPLIENEQFNADTMIKICQEKENISKETATETDRLECEKKHTKQMLKKLFREKEFLEYDLNTCDAQCIFLENIWKNMQNETNDEWAKINRKLNEYIESMDLSSTDSYEKHLLMDALRKDMEEYRKEYISTLHQIWLVTRENNEKNSEFILIEEKLRTEQLELTNSKNLLQDLQKNTLLMNEIPEKWFQSFEKQKKEYQMLLKDRTKLEKDRNNLIIELDSYGFQRSQSHTLQENLKIANESNKEDPKHAKSVYDAFKDRLKKGDSIIPETTLENV